MLLVLNRGYIFIEVMEYIYQYKLEIGDILAANPRGTCPYKGHVYEPCAHCSPILCDIAVVHALHREEVEARLICHQGLSRINSVCFSYGGELAVRVLSLENRMILEKKDVY